MEDLSQSTPYSNVYANPDGSWTEQTSPVPFQTQAGDGSWQPIDTDLTTTADGSLAPTNSLDDVSFSDGGDTTVASMSLDGQHLGWEWASKLPTPTVSGPTATYQITSNEQLVVTATATGFSEDIVLTAPPTSQAAADFTLPIQTGTGTLSTEGPTSAQGAVFSAGSGPDAGKNLLWAAPPTAYDSAKGTGHEDGPSSAPVSLGAGTYTPGAAPAANGGGTAGTPGQAGSGTGNVGISLAPDWSWLTSPSTVYPVTIDPSFSSLTTGDTWVNSSNTSQNNNGDSSLQVGDNTTQDWVARAFLHFNNTGISNLAGMDVTSATLRLRNIDANSCTGATINAQRVSGDWNNNTVTWANQPTVAAWAATFSPAYGYSSACGSNFATWDVTPIVQAWATGANDNYGIRLAANTETNANSWRVYRAQEYGTAADEPQLDITYTVPGPTAGSFTTSPGGSGYTTSLTPTLSVAMPATPSAETVTFTLTDSDGDTVGTYPATVAAGATTASVTVPDEDLDAGQTYTATIQATYTAPDGTNYPLGSLGPESFSTDLYGASVPAITTCADTCVATSLTEPLYSGQIGAGETVVVDPDPSADFDFEPVAMLYGNITTTATGSGSLWVYDGDYQQPAAATSSYAAGSTTQTISLVPADDGSITVYNSGTVPVTVSITATTEDTTADDSGDDDEDDSGDSSSCIPTADTACPAAAGVSSPPGTWVGVGADPGIFNDTATSQYFIYTTGDGFPEMHASSATGTYSTLEASMFTSRDANGEPIAQNPAWVSTKADGGHVPDMWAPDVIKIGSQWVMYYSAWSAADIHKTSCIGIATATSAKGPFTDIDGANGPFLCDPNSTPSDPWSAIDPTGYINQNGTHYLIWKTATDNNKKGWNIRYLRLDAAGTGPAKLADGKLTVPQPLHHAANIPMEAPSLIYKDNHVWMFTAREQWNTCEYYTDVWKAKNVSSKFTLAKTYFIRRTSSKSTCGTGGADIVGGGSFLAYHAWRDGVTPVNDPDAAHYRDIYVTGIDWSTGSPKLSN